MKLLVIVIAAAMLGGCIEVDNDKSTVGDGNIIADNSSDGNTIETTDQDISGNSNLDDESVTVTNAAGVITKYSLVDGMFVVSEKDAE